MLKRLKKADILVIKSIDRLGRSYKEVMCCFGDVNDASLYAPTQNDLRGGLAVLFAHLRNLYGVITFIYRVMQNRHCTKADKVC